MFRELNFPIIRADVLEMSVFHLESAFDCAELDKAEPLVYVPRVDIRCDNGVELQNPEICGVCLSEAVLYEKLSDVKPPAI